MLRSVISDIRRPLCAALLLAGMAVGLSCSVKKENTSEVIGREIIADLLTRHELMMYRSSELVTFHYSEACAGMGAVKMAVTLHDTLLLAQLESRYRPLFNQFDTLPTNHVDANVLGILPLAFYNWNKNREYRRMGIAMADKQWESPLEGGFTNQTRYWIDDIFMIGSLQTESYNATGDSVYLNRAAIEISSYLEKLQQPNGLFYHGPDAQFFWGRGNGWVAAGLAELLLVLPQSNSQYPLILQGYRKMMEALLKYQTPDGMWRQLIDRDEAWEESSCTAMFGYALCAGVNRGLLPRVKYKKAYQKAWKALVNRMDETGKLTEICAGTGQSTKIRYYLERPRIVGDLHGQAPMLWFANALMEGDFKSEGRSQKAEVRMQKSEGR